MPKKIKCTYLGCPESAVYAIKGQSKTHCHCVNHYKKNIEAKLIEEDAYDKISVSEKDIKL